MYQQPPGNGPTVPTPAEGGIVWFGSLKAGLAEARRTNRAVLLLSAAPQCHGTPGIW